jgi:hypothetical protein
MKNCTMGRGKELQLQVGWQEIMAEANLHKSSHPTWLIGTLWSVIVVTCSHFSERSSFFVGFVEGFDSIPIP